MSPDPLFGNTVTALERMLDFQSERHTVLSTNVAHVDTPGYKGKDVRFSDELKRAIDTGGTIPLERTNQKHLPVGLGQMQGGNRTVQSNDAVRRLDGNTVDLDKEMTKLAENSLYYNVTAQIVSKKMRLLRTAISEVR